MDIHPDPKKGPRTSARPLVANLDTSNESGFANLWLTKRYPVSFTPTADC